MFFRDYKAHFNTRRLALRFEPGTVQKGTGCETKFKPSMPPWMMNWAILFPDGLHVRVKEYFLPMAHPNYAQGLRKQFSYQYGPTTSTDLEGMPWTQRDKDTVIRLDLDQWGPHMHYGGKSHLKQESLNGSFKITDAEVFAFVEAVQTCRQSGCQMEDILLFSLKKDGTR